LQAVARATGRLPAPLPAFIFKKTLREGVGPMMDITAPVKDLVLRMMPGKMLHEVKKRHYYNILKNFREEEEKDMAVLPFMVEPGEMVLDIGANIGIYTRLLARLVGQEGAVHSIEAVPATFGILEGNVERLELRNVRVLNYAVSDTDGIVSMEIPDFRGFYRAKITGTSEPAEAAEDRAHRVQVDSRRLDSLFAHSNRPIAFIKCDVEGHELNCIKGAMEITGKWSPAWLMEIGDDPDVPGSRGQQLLDFFLERGYVLYWFDGKALQRRRYGDASVNYFILQAKHLEKMRRKGIPFPIID
jgi:FkbM family methyltransferase